MNLPNKGKGTADPKATTVGCCFIALLPLSLLGYMGFPVRAGTNLRGMHPSPNLGGHQHAAGWLLLIRKGRQLPSNNTLYIL